MLTIPRQIERTPEPFLALRTLVSMAGMPHVLPGRIRYLFDRLRDEGIAPAGPLTFRYNVVDMERELEIDIGVPIAAAVEAPADFVRSIIPGGRYLSITYVGPYDTGPTDHGEPDGLYGANGVLIGWARDNGTAFDEAPLPRGDVFASRLEIYRIDMSTEPDPAKWETEVAIRLSDAAG